MVRFKTFRSALKKIKKIDILEVHSGTLFSVKTAVFDSRTKEFRFIGDGKEEGIELVLSQYGITEILRVDTDDDKFVFNINLKDGRQYRAEFVMRENYTFFAADDYKQKNIEKIFKTLPTYLEKFVGKKVQVERSQVSEVFTVADENGGESNLIADKYIIPYFSFEHKIQSGVIVCDVYDAERCGISSAILDIKFVTNNLNDDGSINEKSVVLGTHYGEYILTIID